MKSVSFETREAALSAAIDNMLVTSQSDTELIKILSKLHLEDPQAKPLSVVIAERLKKVSMFKKNIKTDFSELLYIAAKSDAFLVNEEAVISRIESMVSGHHQLILNDEKRNEQTSFLLAKLSPWAETIGILLNETQQKIAPLWPIICALTPVESKQIFKAALPCESEKVFNSLVYLVCEVRDAHFLNDLEKLAPSARVLTKENAQRCAKTLIRHYPHTRARSNLNVDQNQALEQVDLTLSIFKVCPSKDLAEALMKELCLDNFCLPEQMPSEWKPVMNMLSKMGVKALDVKDMLLLVSEINELRECHKIDSHLSQDKADVLTKSGKRVRLSQLDENAQIILKSLILPRRMNLSQDNPPLMYSLMEMLPKMGPKASKSVIDYVDKEIINLNKEEMQWKRSGSGFTQNIGSAIVNLAKNKNNKEYYEGLIKKWLCVLADKGFDFDAKATSKSKSLGERLRTSQQLKQFWSLVESRIIALEIPRKLESKKTSSL